MPLSRGRWRPRPKGLSRLGRAGLVTGRAAERGPFPLGRPLAPGAGVRGQTGPRPEVAASHLPLPSPWAFPRPGPGLRPPRPPEWPTPSPRDSQLLPRTQHRGPQLGLGRRICRPHHPVTGLRSVTTTTAAAFFLGLLGAPPTSLSANDR